VAQFIDRAAPSIPVVLILGESGTGRNWLRARRHYKSTRKRRGVRRGQLRGVERDAD